MGEPNVAIGESELNLIGEYVQSHLSGWMEQLGVRAPQDPVTNTQLLERVFRVEEELKAGRDVMIARFEASDKRFESIDLRIGDLIRTMDDRFNGLTKTMDERFKTVDERFRSAAKATDDRFTDLIKMMDDRFNSLTKTMDERFKTVDERFRSAAKATDDRFTDLIKVMDHGFVGVKQNIGLVKWFIVSSFVVIGAAISLVAFLQ